MITLDRTRAPTWVIQDRQDLYCLRQRGERFLPFKRVLDILIIVVVAAVAPVLAQGDQAFHVTSDTVAVYATVRDHDGRLVPDLTKNDFQILDNGKPATITTFSRTFCRSRWC